jgi:hypothetical protein
MTKTDITEWAKRNGFAVDRYGHLVNGTTRLKLSSVAVRWEVKRDICGKNEWIRMRSGYLSKLSVSNDGRLVGLTR